ncbi:phosphoribosylanthranilate isomerase [Natronoglycomyces albus]|uniref:N-(5'-phosphoribosyl)anthranilate isomerase n=1 Tax=Natronoglycomyces albus TaxID=2811108 RepID=A0A895XKY0_9ACTN|nr:phosphoribosylanthranilate isomerase [Natronoglycomyces albus]QSB04462.1 phosphoribosylanthranilate isomerase [Natronoglycomyces albus]
MFVKICGLTEFSHVEAAVDAGANAIGFLLSPSPRQVTVDRARSLAAAVPDSVLTVGVFAQEGPDEIRKIATQVGLRAVQLHGAYTQADFAALRDLPFAQVRAIAGSTEADTRCGAFGEDYLIVDSPRPGSGEEWDWSCLPSRPTGKWLLAGGLRPDTVARAIAQAKPWGVDVSSGVEKTRGVKDPSLIRRFVAAARCAQ